MEFLIGVFLFFLFFECLGTFDTMKHEDIEDPNSKDLTKEQDVKNDDN